MASRVTRGCFFTPFLSLIRRSFSTAEPLPFVFRFELQRLAEGKKRPLDTSIHHALREVSDSPLDTLEYLALNLRHCVTTDGKFDSDRWKEVQQIAPESGNSTNRCINFQVHLVSLEEQRFDFEVKRANRVLRYFWEYRDRFLTLSLSPKALKDARLEAALMEGITVVGRQFFYFTDKSETLRLFAPTDDGPPELRSVDALLEWIGDFTDVKPSKTADRVGLALSTSTPVYLNKSDVHVIEDVLQVAQASTASGRNRYYCASDGVGYFGSDVGEQIRTALALAEVPSAVQARIGGVKGLFSFRPAASGLAIRPSMIKFSSTSTTLDILLASPPASTPPAAHHLSHSSLLNLVALGVPIQTFLQYQANAIEHLLAPLLSSSAAISYVQDCPHEHNSREKLLAALHAGHSIDEPYLNHLFRQSYGRQLLRHYEQIITKAWIPVEKSGFGYGILDEEGVLNPGEICLPFLQADGKEYYEGPVLISRYPNHHPGDIRLLTAVAPPPALQHLHNVVIFAQQGLNGRPEPDKMSGGDLDGDRYFFLTEPSFMPKDDMEPANYGEYLVKHRIEPFTVRPSADEGRTYPDRKDMLARVLKYLRGPKIIGQLTYLHLAHADLDGAASQKAMHLAVLAAEAVDNKKSDMTVECPNTPSFKVPYPHYLPNLAYTRHSRSVVGQLHDQAKAQAKFVSRSSYFVNSLDNDILMEGYEEYIPAARSLFAKYRNWFFDIMKNVSQSSQQEATQDLDAKCWSEAWKVVGCEDKMCLFASACYYITYSAALQKQDANPWLQFPWVFSDYLNLIKASKTADVASVEYSDGVDASASAANVATASAVADDASVAGGGEGAHGSAVCANNVVGGVRNGNGSGVRASGDDAKAGGSASGPGAAVAYENGGAGGSASGAGGDVTGGGANVAGGAGGSASVPGAAVAYENGGTGEDSVARGASGDASVAAGDDGTHLDGVDGDVDRLGCVGEHSAGVVGDDGGDEARLARTGDSVLGSDDDEAGDCVAEVVSVGG